MRRQRFTIETADGEKVVALGYTAEGLREAYARRYGEEPLFITRGDYRIEQRAAERRAVGGFTIDRQALAEAKRLLGITKPLDIRQTSRHGSQNGNHQFDGLKHRIMVKSYLTPDEATSTLWHELTHCRQAEQAGGRMEWREVVNSQKRRSRSYWHRPIEVEARDMARRMAPLHKLAR